MAAGARVTVIVSDASRAEPRAALLAVLRRRLPGVRWTIAIATGTHGPASLGALGIPDELRADAASSTTTAIVARRPGRARHHLARDPGPDPSLRGRGRAGDRDRLHPPALLRRVRRRREGDLPGPRRGARDPHEPRAQDRSPAPARESSTAIRVARISRRRCALVPTPTFLLNGVCGARRPDPRRRRRRSPSQRFAPAPPRARRGSRCAPRGRRS